MQTIETKLAQLRQEWIKHPEKRKIIELQAEILKWKPNDYTLKREKEEKRLASDVVDTLFK
jgi:hypothetical protein